SAGDLYPYLTETPITEAELGRKTQKSRKAVRNGLHKLQQAGLAVKTDKGWVRGTVTLEEAARALGCTIQGDKRRKRHQVDRA
ncbi:MAG TPA: hypothetical protein VFM18_20145, partial [Methanosarcina sp.]|nr:hypothetical protein [Methanosarcina sp.]